MLAKLGVELDSKMSMLDAPIKAPPAKWGKVATTEEKEVLMDAFPNLRARMDAL